MQSSCHQSSQREAQVRQKIKSYLPSMKCAFHEKQSLTNFCSCKKCLLPLCPSCIKIHTIQHLNMRQDAHPQYQNLNDMIYELNQDLREFVYIYQENFDQIVQLEAKIHQFKSSILGNINKLRDQVVNQIQNYFNQVIQETQKKITSVSYVKNLLVYKQQTKKILQSIKQIQKNLYSPNHKLMRTLIKYQSSEVENKLNQFNVGTRSFIDKLDGNFCTLSVKQTFKDGLYAHLSNIYKIQINQINMMKSDQPFNITSQLKQFIQKANQKRQIKKSLGHIISKMSNSKQGKDNQSPEKKENLNNKHIKLIMNNKQNQVPLAISSSMMIFDSKKYKHNAQQTQKDITLKLFSNDRRSFMNHSSQKKQLKFDLNNTQSFCSADFLNLSALEDIDQQGKSMKNNKQKRSGSRSRGLSLLQIQNENYCKQKGQTPKNKGGQLRSKMPDNRGSFLGIQNMNLDFISSKTQYMQRKK